ncbi:extracellular calcium-sensing receptor-like [Polypterus senegalus]|uniref:extracellular calcium-sensing receptor-like n=1 Tax=Polypterus senegalus TaxID=55291 RepID=UPI0019632C06|nr:extracellular calcium-sensing receptor-like [Polypterus senegalus]
MKFIVCVTLSICCIVVVASVKQSTCKIQEIFQLNQLYKEGDVILGGLFELTSNKKTPDLSFSSKPEQWTCEGIDLVVFQWVQIMIFAIEEINKNQTLLPNITLGYQIYDNCAILPVALRAAASLLGGLEYVISDEECKGRPPVLAIIGDPASTNSIAISRILNPFQVPQVSYSASCSCLSNKQEYPSFFRTMPSDAFQVKAIVHIVKHYGWSWIGCIASEDDYGQNAIKSFIEEAEKFGCIAFKETIPKTNAAQEISQIVKIIKESTAKVIVIFSADTDFMDLAQEIIVNKFWETMFECKFQDNLYGKSPLLLSGDQCTGHEDMKTTKTAYSDVSHLRVAYNIYKAVYALAHALHSLSSCENGKGPFEYNTCASIENAQPWQLLHYFKEVNFVNQLGERVAFDKNGDALAIYDIINWQQLDDGTINLKAIGVFDESAPVGQELLLNKENMFWNFESGQIPKSVCSESCLPGFRKAIRKGQPICCFDCISCADGEISTEIDSTECFKCPVDFWSNAGRNQCVLKEIEFLSYEDAMGITLTTTALSGACLTIGILMIFIQYRNTPVVKANNSELSFLLLVSLTLCFLCSLCFIGRPSHFTCVFMYAIFGISFVLCISCILVKTLVVIMAFKATLPGSNAMKWFGIAQQRGTVFFFTAIQLLICVIWLSISPPVPSKNTKYQNSKIILECDIASLFGFSCLLGYIGLLACICFILAFLARKLPDNFNEAKFITFSMLIFCAVWITFIPAYISSPGKYTVAVEVFAILASSFGILFAIFTPKCYIILLKPEQNTKKALMGR